MRFVLKLIFDKAEKSCSSLQLVMSDGTVRTVRKNVDIV